MKHLSKKLLNAALWLFIITQAQAALPANALAAAPSKTLIVALLPIFDVLPAHVAQENGYFRENGISVKTLSVGSALERDQLMQAGKIDGMLNEIASTASFNRDQVRLQIIASARTPMGQSPLFRVLSAPKSGILNASALKNVPIAVSKNTIIEFITDRLLTHAGLSMDEIQTRSVPVLPERMQLLLSGQIKAATLPDPLGASALKAGANQIINDLDMPGTSVSVLSFSASALKDKKEAVALYLNAWTRGARDLNHDPDAYRGLVLKKIRVPANIRNDFKIPPFPVNRIPSEGQWDEVMRWMIEKKLLKSTLAYKESVNSVFLK